MTRDIYQHPTNGYLYHLLAYKKGCVLVVA